MVLVGGACEGVATRPVVQDVCMRGWYDFFYALTVRELPVL